MSRTKSDFTPESFTNSIGQVIRPGDEVVAIATGYGHSVSVFKGIFEGVYKANENSWSEKGTIVGSRVGSIPYVRHEYEYTEDGAHDERAYDYKRNKYVATGRRYNLVPTTKYRKSTLQRNRVFKIDTSLTSVSNLI